MHSPTPDARRLLLAHNPSWMLLAGSLILCSATSIAEARFAGELKSAPVSRDATAGAAQAAQTLAIGGQQSNSLVRMWNDPLTGQAMYSATTNGRDFSRALPVSNVIQLRYAAFDPVNVQAVEGAGEPPIADALRITGDANNAERTMIVQFVVPPLPAMLDELRAAGATPLAYLPDQCFIARMNDATKAAAMQLQHVRWIGEYHTAYRLEEPLVAALQDGVGASLPTQKYSIQMLERGPAAQNIVAQRIAELGGEVHLTIPQGFRIEATLSAAQLLEVAQMSQIMFIDRKGEPGEDMDNARAVSGATPTLSNAGFTGQGVRGEVMDGGVRLTHNAFQGPGILLHGPNGTSTSHGTSTTGCVFGNGANNASGTGMVPNREQAIFAAYTALTNRYTHTQELVNPVGPYRAVFQSNSWGDPTTVSYTTISSEMDDLLFDHDILICQSQSNTGNQTSRPQAWAKNIVSIGGISHANNQSRTDDTWTSASVGPAADGRIKPDLAHFYDNVTCTSSTSNTSYTTGFNGTSAATPIVAGTFGLLFQMWHEQVFPGFGGGSSVFDSRAHMMTAKALMINTAYRYNWLAGGPNGNLTRVRQGWGMPDLARLYNERANLFILDERDVIEPLGVLSYEVDVAAGQPDFRATMTYRDPAGTTSAALHRINDLSMRVTSPNGTEYWGNNGLSASNFSTSGGVSNTKDTVENVFVASPLAGTWTIEVFGDTIVQDAHAATPATDATFALVVTGIEHPALVYGDITGDGIVDVADLLEVITSWGTCPVPPTACPADIAPLPSGDGEVNVSDLLAIITNWSA